MNRLNVFLANSNGNLNKVEKLKNKLIRGIKQWKTKK